MIGEFLRALFMAGLPVGVMSYLLIWWALRAEYFERVTDMKQLGGEVKRLSKERKDSKKRAKAVDRPLQPKYTPVHNKWLTFGGGFYGVVALLTFAIVELGEIRSFFAQFSENVGKLAQLDAGLIVDFIIESIMNFVTAIAWPMYWISAIRSGHIWIWFLAAYAGYWLGARAALRNRARLNRAP